MRHPETVDEQAADGEEGERRAGPPQPGVVLIFSGGAPQWQVLRAQDSAVELGRESLGTLTDPLLSRRHARIEFEGEEVRVRDLGSRNGSAVDGVALQGERRYEGARVLRAGGTLFLLCADVRPLLGGVAVVNEAVVGPSLRRAFDGIASAARFASSLHIHGESGAGKERLAQAFHRLGPHPEGPFIAVNCAAIPEGVAERLLFGARKGAYSGAAADAEGYIQAAHGGTLFLDEVADLELPVQGKLLRMLETKEVLPLGATRPRAVDLRICSATHKDLRAQVAAGRLREDLYFRIGRPQVDVPPLRERLEEVPLLIERELGRCAAHLRAHVSLVEACLLRPWPGNVRELLGEVRTAAQTALAAKAAEVKGAHLAADAGVAFRAAPEAAGSAQRGGAPSIDVDREAVEAALARAGGNVSQAARDLKMHRTQLRRLLARYAPAGRARR